MGNIGWALHLRVWLKLLPAENADTERIVNGANIETVFVLYRDNSSKNVKIARN